MNNLNVNSDHSSFTLYNTFMNDLDEEESLPEVSNDQETPQAETVISASPSILTTQQMEQRRELDALVVATERSPLDSRERRVRSVLSKPNWESFSEKLETLATFWNRKLVDRTFKLLSGVFTIGSGYLAYAFMARSAAFAASRQTSVPSSSSSTIAPPNIKTLQYAGAAGLLANGLTILQALPQTVNAVSQIVSVIKTGVAIRKNIQETEAALTKYSQKLETALNIRNNLSEQTDLDKIEQKIAKYSTQTLELEKSLSSYRTTLSGLPLNGVITATFGAYSALNVAHAAVATAMIGIYASSHGAAQVTIAALSHAGAVMGVVGGAIGVFFGGVALAFNLKTAVETYSRIEVLKDKIDELRVVIAEMEGPKKTLAEYQLKLLENELLEEKDKQSHNAITAASNTFLTYAGIVSFVAVTASPSVVGSLVLGGIALSFVGISACISIGHYFYRKHTDEILAAAKRANSVNAAEIENFVKGLNPAELGDELLIEFIPTWVDESEREKTVEKMKTNLTPYLLEHFKPLTQ